MDGGAFDRITRTLAATGIRRNALRGAFGAGFGTLVARLGIDTEAKKRKKRKKKKKKSVCREQLESCGPGQSCCGAQDGTAACGASNESFCQAVLPDAYCCGLEGAVCNPDAANCDCCDDLLCSPVELLFLCQKPT